MDWSKYSALKSDSKASMAKEELKAAVLYEEGDSMPEGKSAGDEKAGEKARGWEKRHYFTDSSFKRGAINQVPCDADGP